MSDSLDISVEDVVDQYQEEIAKQINEKVLLQAAVKVLSKNQEDLLAQIQQLSEDLAQAMERSASQTSQVLDPNFDPLEG